MKNDVDVTELLAQWQEGDGTAIDQLLPVVYDELRRIAHREMRRERADHTLNTTALVHEAYLNLARSDGGTPWESRAHFFAISARVMRRVLIWYARKRNADKRGGGKADVRLDDMPEGFGVFTDDRIEELLALNQAMERLEAMDERLCRVVECRHFAGLSVVETGQVLNISPATVKRDWKTARAWLRNELRAPE